METPARALFVALAALIVLPSSAVAKTKIDDLSCEPGEIPKFDGADWVCSDDLFSLSEAIAEIGGFGCSAQQQGNSVLITCGDGTAGVLAGRGTVVIYPEGQIGQVPPIEYNTGPIVAFDATGVALGRVDSFAASQGAAWPDMVRIYLDCPGCVIHLNNLPVSQQVIPSYPSGTGVHFLADDCTGTPFIENGPMEIDGQLYVPLQPSPAGPILFGSLRSEGRMRYEPTYNLDEPFTVIYDEPSECMPYSHLKYASPAVEYLLAPEIVNAAYPVRVEQLP